MRWVTQEARRARRRSADACLLPSRPLPRRWTALTVLARRADACWDAPRAELAPLRALRGGTGVPAAPAPTLLRRRAAPAEPSVPTELRRAACMPACMLGGEALFSLLLPAAQRSASARSGLASRNRTTTNPYSIWQEMSGAFTVRRTRVGGQVVMEPNRLGGRGAVQARALRARHLSRRGAQCERRCG